MHYLWDLYFFINNTTLKVDFNEFIIGLRVLLDVLRIFKTETMKLNTETMKVNTVNMIQLMYF